MNLTKSLFTIGLTCFALSASASSAINERVDALTGLKATELIPATSTQAAGWIDLKNICFSNSNYDINSARQACEDAAEVVNLLSNDRLVFQANCQPQASAEKCTYSYGGSILHVRALSVPQ